MDRHVNDPYVKQAKLVRSRSNILCSKHTEVVLLLNWLKLIKNITYSDLGWE